MRLKDTSRGFRLIDNHKWAWEANDYCKQTYTGGHLWDITGNDVVEVAFRLLHIAEYWGTHHIAAANKGIQDGGFIDCNHSQCNGTFVFYGGSIFNYQDNWEVYLRTTHVNLNFRIDLSKAIEDNSYKLDYQGGRDRFICEIDCRVT